MNQKELFSLFPPTCALKERLLLIPPTEFYKLEGRCLHNCRIFLLVCKGCLTLQINNLEHEMRSRSFLDLFDGMTVYIKEVSPDLRAYCLLPNHEFASEALKNLKPGPENYLLERIQFPILHISDEENNVLENQFNLLKNILRQYNHQYRKELIHVYFKSFALEVGNMMFIHSKNINEKTTGIFSKQDMIALSFLRLVTANFHIEHNIDFYAKQLGISTKHLSRIIKEKFNATPHEFIRNELLHHAMSLLEDERIPIQQIADMLHFSDQASFCKFFKKHKQMSPIQYRKQTR